MTVQDMGVSEYDQGAADKALPTLRSMLIQDQEAERFLLGQGHDAQIEVPRSAVVMLRDILANMAAGRTMSLLPHHAELTTQQAADILNVSRPYVIKLVEAGELDCHRVGTHRRLKAGDVLAYKKSDDLKRKKEADELTRLTEELG